MCSPRFARANDIRPSTTARCCSLVANMKRRFRAGCVRPPAGLVLGLLTAILAACGGGAPASAPASSGAAGGWDQVIAAAKREGALVVVGQAGSGVADALTTDFKRQYPDIQLDFTGANGNESTTKLLTERQANRYTTDLMINGPPNLLDLSAANALDPLPPLLAGPDEDPSHWAGQKFNYSDNAGQYVMAMLGGAGAVGIYNPKL